MRINRPFRRRLIIAYFLRPYLYTIVTLSIVATAKRNNRSSDGYFYFTSIATVAGATLCVARTTATKEIQKFDTQIVCTIRFINHNFRTIGG